MFKLQNYTKHKILPIFILLLELILYYNNITNNFCLKTELHFYLNTDLYFFWR